MFDGFARGPAQQPRASPAWNGRCMAVPYFMSGQDELDAKGKRFVFLGDEKTQVTRCNYWYNYSTFSNPFWGEINAMSKFYVDLGGGFKDGFSIYVPIYMGRYKRIWLILIGLEPLPRFCLMVGISWYLSFSKIEKAKKRLHETLLLWNTSYLLFSLQKAYLSERGCKDVRKRWKNRSSSISHDRCFHLFSFSILKSH